MQKPEPRFVRYAKVVKVIDGDTLRLEIDQGFNVKLTTDVRLYGVDTPEVRGVERVAGMYVKAQIETHVREGSEVVLRSERFTVGKYGRCVATVWVGDLNLNDWLLTERLGWKISDSGKRLEPRDVRSLNLPNGIKTAVTAAIS